MLRHPRAFFGSCGVVLARFMLFGLWRAFRWPSILALTVPNGACLRGVLRQAQHCGDWSVLGRHAQ